LRRLFPVLALLLVAPPLVGDEATSPDKPKFTFQVVLSDLEPIRDREERKPEVFYASVAASYSRKGWGAAAEVRGREGKFRPYFSGPVWVETAYAWADTPAGRVSVGKVERSFGLADGTFGGNLFSLLGVTRNPDWGAALSGSKRFGYDELAWSAGYLGRNDHVAWEEDGAGVESDSDASLLDGLESRATYTVNKGLWSIRPGLSASTARIAGTGGVNRLRVSDVEGDLRATFGPISVEAMTFWRDGDLTVAVTAGRAGSPRAGYDEGWAWLLAFAAEFPTVTYRYSYSEWSFRGIGGNDRIHQPSVVWHPWKWLEATIEYSARRRREGSDVRTFNAFRLGLRATY
jgi:hypothetical protein